MPASTDAELDKKSSLLLKRLTTATTLFLDEVQKRGIQEEKRARVPPPPSAEARAVAIGHQFVWDTQAHPVGLCTKCGLSVAKSRLRAWLDDAGKQCIPMQEGELGPGPTSGRPSWRRRRRRRIGSTKERTTTRSVVSEREA